MSPANATKVAKETKQSRQKMSTSLVRIANQHTYARLEVSYVSPHDPFGQNESIDPTFRFMTVDWDGRIRMDPSSPYAMQSLIGLKDKFDIAFAADTDHDRHGIVTKSTGLLSPNHYLAVCVQHLFADRKKWGQNVAVGKTVVSSSIIDRVTARLGRRLYEVPVGFKWFVEGLLNGRLGFAGEESAGASFLRRDGDEWTTDKDGIVPGLLSAEITARMGRDPGEIYSEITRDMGDPLTSAWMLPPLRSRKPLSRNCHHPIFALLRLPAKRSS